MTKYTDKDAAKDTDSSTSKVNEAWHDARDHASEVERNVSKTSHKVNDSSFGSILKDFFWGK